MTETINRDQARENWANEKQRTQPERFGTLSRNWSRRHPGARCYPYATKEDKQAAKDRQAERDQAPRFKIGERVA